MTGRTIDVRHLPAFEISPQEPLYIGQLCLAAIEASMFFIMVAMYFYVRLSMDVWPPPGANRPDALLPSLALIPLLISCAGSYIASEGAKKNDRGRMLLGLGMNLAFALVFLAARYFWWKSWTFTWYKDAYGSLLWVIVGLHTYDAVADLIFTAVLIFLLATRRYGEKERLGVHVDSIVWYVIAGIWLVLYATLVWGARV